MIRRYLTSAWGHGSHARFIINIYHEPSTFNGAERPDTDLLIVPSTWQQVIAGLYGAAGAFRYQLYVTPGLRADGFTADAGIRGGRQEKKFAPVTGVSSGVSIMRHSSVATSVCRDTGPRPGRGSNLGDVAVTVAALDTKLSRWGLRCADSSPMSM